MTSKHFASEDKFVQVCKTFDKMKIIDDEEFFETPYLDKSKQKIAQK